MEAEHVTNEAFEDNIKCARAIVQREYGVAQLVVYFVGVVEYRHIAPVASRCLAKWKEIGPPCK